MTASTAAAHAELDYRPSYAAAAIAATLVFLLYLVTLSPSTAMWDTSEYIAAAYTLGLPHPPGNPMFVLLGRVFSILPIAPNVAMRINILAALSSAVSAGMWFLIVERVLVAWLPKRWQRISGGALAALIGATAFTVWAQSVVNEKVYTVSLVGMAIVAWLTVRWCDDPEGPKADRLLILVAYLSGLGYSNHMAGFLALPAVLVAVLVIRPRNFLRGKLILAGALAIVLGMTPFLTQPIRSAYFPRINEGETTGCATKIAVGCTFSDTTYQRFMYNFNREQYQKPAVTERQIPFPSQVGMWWLYFKWQWLRDPDGTHAAAQSALASIFLILGLVGGYVHWRRDRRSFWFFGPLIFSVTLLLIYYMNFKYGASQAPELGDAVPREVRDRDYFYLWSYSAWSVWVALGLFYVWEQVAQMIGSDPARVGGETVQVPRQRSWIAASPLLVVAFVPLFANWSSASRRGQTDTRDFAHDLLESVEPYGVLITVGDNDTFPLWYAQEVEGVRQDVTVLCTSLLNTDWYTRQLIRNRIRPYDAAHGPQAYAGRIWPMPTKAPVTLTFAQSNAVPPIVEINGTQELKTASGQTFTVHARDLGNGYHGLERADLFVLYIIRDAFPGTPVFFSRTDGSYPDEMGFGEHLVSTGLARKLVANVPTPTPTLLNVQGEGWFDLGTTYSLWTRTFDGPASLARRTRWVDGPSAGIPFAYVHTGAVLGRALQQAGRPADAQNILATTEKITHSTRLGRILAADREGQ
ncbi:MAG: glycosyltransferase family 117 protein [Gemmatimonadaceae bacterium]